jgi:RHS repeat-associated protein
MREARIHRSAWALLTCAAILAISPPARAEPETQRCLTREQLNIEPIFSACPPLAGEASVSDNSFISKLYLDRGYDSYALRWQGPDYFHEQNYDWNPATGAYEGFCGTRFCELYPPAWVQQEHWSYFVGTLLAKDVGTWTYSELRGGEVFQFRTFEVRGLNLTALSGANQIGLIDTQIPQPLELKLESFEGTGIEGEVIGWSMTGPKGAKRATVTGIGSGSETDGKGIDQAFIRLGSKPGSYTVTLNNRRVTQESQPSFTFTAIDDIEDANPAEEHPDFEEGVGENRAQQCDSVGNPIGLSLGNKFQREVDLPATGISPIEFVRYHNSLGFVSRSFANYWTHSYDRYVEVPNDPQVEPVKVVRPDGKKLNFFWNGSGFQPFAGVHAALEQTADGWRFTDPQLTTENFDGAGLLVEITDLAGRRQTATHDTAGKLLGIADNLGGYLTFGYDGSGRLATVTDQAGRTWTYRYEALGRLAYVDQPDGTTRGYHYEDLRHAYALTGITTESGQRWAHYEYDEQGRAIASWHAGDADRVDIQYQDNGDRVVVDPVGNATIYQTRIENKRGFLDAISGPVCAQGCGQTDTQYSYDADGNITRRTAYGVVTDYGDYDDKGQPAYVVQAVGTPEEKRTEYAYDPGFRNRITRISEPSVYPSRSRITTRDFDFGGNLLRETVTGFDPFGQPVSRTLAYAYDGPFGQVSAMDGPRADVSDIITYEYYPNTDAAGVNRARLKAVVDPNGMRVRDNIVYSPTGKIRSEDRLNGVTVLYEYYAGNDRIHSLTESADGLFNRTRWEYLPTGEVQRISVDDEAGDEIITQFHYDDARRLSRVESRVSGGPSYTPDQWVSYEFDAAGNIVAERLESRDDPHHDLLIERVFDAWNHLDTITRGGVTEDLDYRPDGTLAARTDGKLNTSRYDYDAFQRLTSTERIGQVTTTLAYDTHGNTLSVTDPEGHTTRYRYDDLGNRVEQDSPDSGTTRYVHDEAGQLVAQTDAGGQSSSLSYDPAGRITAVDREGPDHDLNYVYDNCSDGLGRLCEITTGWGHSIRYAWNALGELRSVTSSEGRIGYSWGPQGALTSIEYPSGRIVRFGLDGGGLVQEIRLQQADMPEAVLVGEIGYSSLGRPVSWRFANGLQTAVQLDARQRPLRFDVPGVFAWVAAGYDQADNLLGLATPGAEFAYRYDALDRLTAADAAEHSLGFTYDDVGNRLSKISNGVSESGSYEPGSNRIAAFGNSLFTLDPNGNTASVAIGGLAAFSYLYSPHNRLVGVIDDASSGILATYRYDALGQRVEKSGAGQMQKFLYGPNGELLAVTDGLGKILHEFVYLDGQPLVDLFEISAAPPQEPPAETIIDNGQANVFGANWQVKTSASAVNGSFVQNRKRDNRGVYWYIDETGASGAHDIFVRWVNPAGDGTSTRYGVRVINELQTGYDSSNVTVNHADHQEGDWVFLGNFDIKPRHSSLRQSVELTGFDNRYGYEGTFLEADAVKLVPTFVPAGSSDIRFIHGDHLGTPQTVTDEAGQVVWSASYLPFGEATVDEDPDGDDVAYELNLRFPGQYHDAESGLHYNYYRDYDPGTGRYLESDPMGLGGGLNTFTYVGNNPVTETDPLGLYQMCHRDMLVRLPYARHCYARFADGTTSSFSNDGVNADADPDNPRTVCTNAESVEKDSCIKQAMRRCLGSNYHFIRFNCCHCVEQALKECGTSVPPSEWPNWPVNPGPQPGEPGYTPLPVYDPTLGG